MTRLEVAEERHIEAATQDELLVSANATIDRGIEAWERERQEEEEILAVNWLAGT